MSASRIVLMRHGQTDFNLARRFQGRIDKPLNEAGRSQAAGAAGVLVSRLCEPSAEVGMIAAEDGRSYDDGGVRIVSSPLGRAVDTATIVARVFDIAGTPARPPRQHRARAHPPPRSVPPRRGHTPPARARCCLGGRAGVPR